MAVTTRQQEKRGEMPSSQGGKKERTEEEAMPRKEQKTEHGTSPTERGQKNDQEENMPTKTNNSNAVAKNPKNQPLLDALDQLANAMFSAEEADDKNRFKGVAMKNAVRALANVEFVIQSGDSVSKGENKIRGVGSGTAQYIDEYLAKGRIDEIKAYAQQGQKAKQEEKRNKDNSRYAQSKSSRDVQVEEKEEGDVIEINRAPVLTLWAAVVAQREGYSREEALTYGRWVATVFAQSKGRALGKFDTSKGPPAEEHKVEKEDNTVEKEPDHVLAFGDKKIPISRDEEGNRLAVLKETPVEPSQVEDYLQRKFGEKLGVTEEAMKELAENMDLEDLKENAYDLYTQIRPEWKGWGQKAALHLSDIRQFARS